jgi:hypothetical protein
MLFNDTSHYGTRPRVATGSLSKWWDHGVGAPQQA